MMQVHGIMSEVSVMGANDSEFEGFRQILTELQAGKITPNEAVKQAIDIRDRKWTTINIMNLETRAVGGGQEKF